MRTIAALLLCIGAIDSLRETLPHSTLRICEGQEHNAMDTIPQEFAAAVSSFLVEPHR
jgi:pimeloyl-ACP methyl ester carboxylesterase